MIFYSLIALVVVLLALAFLLLRKKDDKFKIVFKRPSPPDPDAEDDRQSPAPPNLPTA